MTLLDAVKQYVENGASQEDYFPTYAEGRINSMSMFEFLELLSEVDQAILEEGED